MTYFSRLSQICVNPKGDIDVGRCALGVGGEETEQVQLESWEKLEAVRVGDLSIMQEGCVTVASRRHGGASLRYPFHLNS